VLVSSRSDGNSYHPGDREHFEDSDLFCETVIKSGNRLLIPDALVDEHWKNNPDVKLNMVSYLGYPLLFPTGKPFGTVCVLDSKHNEHSPVIVSHSGSLPGTADAGNPNNAQGIFLKASASPI